VVKTLELIEKGAENMVEQDESQATYAPKLTKEMGKIDWNRTAQEIIRQVRAMSPWPGAFTYLDGKVLKVRQAELCDENAKGRPGEIYDTERFIISACDKSICVKMLQLEGKKAMSPGEFLRGYRIKDGTILG
jgi:methionyl-tRNA formyltransferase